MPLDLTDDKSTLVQVMAWCTHLAAISIECLGRQVCVLERCHPATTCISFGGTWFPCEESTTVTGSGMDLRTGDSPSQPVRSGADVCSLESQHQGYHEKSHQPMDRGDCQGSLHSSWSRVWPSYGTWCQSPVSFMGVQLSGSPTWHPVSGVLEVIWGLPEFISTGHGLYRWWHVYSGSSGGRTASSGSRTSSRSSIAYTICMQPLLRCS